jgi:hypothetical protein
LSGDGISFGAALRWIELKFAVKELMAKAEPVGVRIGLPVTISILLHNIYQQATASLIDRALGFL